MENFDLRKYLAENKLLKEDVDVNKILSDGGYDIIDDEELLMTVKSRLKGKSNIDAEKLNLLVMKIEDEEGGNIDFTENRLLKEDITPEYVTTLLSNNGIDDEYFESMGGKEIEGGTEEWMSVLSDLIGKDAYTADYTPEEDNIINNFISTLNKIGIELI